MTIVSLHVVHIVMLTCRNSHLVTWALDDSRRTNPTSSSVSLVEVVHIAMCQACTHQCVSSPDVEDCSLVFILHHASPPWCAKPKKTVSNMFLVAVCPGVWFGPLACISVHSHVP